MGRQGSVGGPPPQGPVPVLAGLMDGNGCSIGTHILSYKPIFKQVLPIAAVQALFNIQRLSYDAPTAFDYVVDQLEASIRSAFSVEQTPVPDTAHQVTRESLLVRSAVSSFVSKAYLMSYLKFNGFNS